MAQEAKRAKGGTNCPHHPGKEVVYVCKQMDCFGELACIECVHTLHFTHPLESLTDNIPNVKKKMEDFIANSQQDILLVEKGIISLKEEINRTRQHHKDVIHQIKQQNIKLKEQLDIATENLVEVCKNSEKNSVKIIELYKNELQKVVDDMQDRLHECRNTLKNGTDILHYDVCHDLPAVYDMPSCPKTKMAFFTPASNLPESFNTLLGEVSSSCERSHASTEEADNSLTSLDSSETTLSNLLSKIQNIWGKGYKPDSVPPTPTKKPSEDNTDSLPTPDHETECKIVSEFGYKSEINTIHPTANNQAWVCSGIDNKINLLDMTGKVKETLEMEVKVTDFCVSPTDGKLWFCSEEDSSIREITGSKSVLKFSTKYTLSFLNKLLSQGTSTSLCVSADGNLFAGIKTTDHHGCIVKFTSKGKELCRKTTQAYPIGMTECPITRNIAVVDKHGTVYVLKNDKLDILYQSDQFFAKQARFNHKGELLIQDIKNRVIMVHRELSDYHKMIYESPIYSTKFCVHNNGDIWVIHTQIPVHSR